MLFFFSSRRRHTRLQGDWSSDVCSSDLVALDAQKEYWRSQGVDLTPRELIARQDRKSTRLNSSHLVISYAVFCLKKKKNSSRPDYESKRDDLTTNPSASIIPNIF